MKKFIKIFLFGGLLFYFYSCEKIFPDETFTIQKTDYNGTQLKISGYFYSSDDSRIYVFYRNGVVLMPGSNNGDETMAKFVAGNYNKDIEEFWGLYIISDQ
jgi:hypothetical protein